MGVLQPDQTLRQLTRGLRRLTRALRCVWISVKVCCTWGPHREASAGGSQRVFPDADFERRGAAVHW
eukprot:7657516-Alexandrium_andersonii.AAC.1